MTEWVKCMDRLPPYAHPVLVFNGNRFEVAYTYNSGTKKKPVVSWSCDYCAFPTHWTELPNPPRDND